jgi:hypothetical protein
MCLCPCELAVASQIPIIHNNHHHHHPFLFKYTESPSLLSLCVCVYSVSKYMITINWHPNTTDLYSNDVFIPHLRCYVVRAQFDIHFRTVFYTNRNREQSMLNWWSYRIFVRTLCLLFFFSTPLKLCDKFDRSSTSAVLGSTVNSNYRVITMVAHLPKTSPWPLHMGARPRPTPPPVVVLDMSIMWLSSKQLLHTGVSHLPPTLHHHPPPDPYSQSVINY